MASSTTTQAGLVGLGFFFGFAGDRFILQRQDLQRAQQPSKGDKQQPDGPVKLAAVAVSPHTQQPRSTLFGSLADPGNEMQALADSFQWTPQKRSVADSCPFEQSLEKHLPSGLFSLV